MLAMNKNIKLDSEEKNNHQAKKPRKLVLVL